MFTDTSENRPDVIKAIEQVYKTSINSDNYHTTVRHREKYEKLRRKDVDVVDGYETDPELMLTNNEFIGLVDDKKVWPKYEVYPVIRREMEKEYPNVTEALRELKGKIRKGDIARLLSQCYEKKIESKGLINDKEQRAALGNIVAKYLERIRMENKTKDIKK